MDEVFFFEKIDNKLNYSRLDEMISFFEQAMAISPLCVFRFLEEVFYARTNKKNYKKEISNLNQILNYVDTHFEHPLKKIIFEAGISKLNRKYLSTKKSLIFMQQVKKFKGLYPALNIIMISCKRNHYFNILERVYDKIILEWSAV